MRELAGRLTALDPDAGAAVKAIAYFDRLVAERAGPEALVRGAAVLAGCPARLVDPERRVRIRCTADGVRRDDDTPPALTWPSEALSPHGRATLWLERAAEGAADCTSGSGTPSVVDSVILERAAGALRTVLDRTRGRAPGGDPGRADDPALVETVLDATAAQASRLHAARTLGLARTPKARAAAVEGGRAVLLPALSDARPGLEVFPPGPVGVGPAVPVLELPASWESARTALRFADDSGGPGAGPRVVYAEDLGSVALLAGIAAPGTEPHPDVTVLRQALADAPWMTATLKAVASAPSMRAAAVSITVHHSTLQERLAHAETLLGWELRSPAGRLRLQLALLLLHLSQPVG
ncbi:helix-turn-helix domain-containing protein [Streptomyces longispororuber]|uniref:helix-turn-helix domain-containing protein n=1 Tax=Streptomyces longispororuber TaxID=68230 RepID=UPI00210C0FC9|nr:helix-turn-helix domain-containing protein [Streptomyces longispororuber]MCQ4209898.1 helix-turn-helix domain-containing protein [Streptomyces longispororuber]